MARISLLFTLALVLAIGSVLAHPPTHKKTKKTVCPSTLPELQKFPFNEISKLLEKESKSAPNTVQFQTMFAIFHAYNDHLGLFGARDVNEVVGSVHSKYAVMTKAMLRVQEFVGIEGELAVKLRNSYATMAEGFVMVVEKVGSISTKYKFNANAKISVSDKVEMEKCVIKLRGAIRVFLKVIHECNKKYSGIKPHFPIGSGFIGAYAKQSIGHAGKLFGLDGNGQVGAGIELGVKAGVHAGAKGQAKVGAHAGANAGVHAGANAGGHIGGFLGGFFGFGGKAQFDAAGKAHVGGGSGFRPLSKPHGKHLNLIEQKAQFMHIKQQMKEP